MTTTLKALGGGAQPASIDTSGKMTGGPALRVYGFDSVEDARAAGYVCEGGPAMSVALITDAQIASGAWKAEGDPAALAVYTAPANMPVEGGLAVPVYPVNGWGSTPVPSGPLFSSAEIGTVNASTLAVTFDSNVTAAGDDYSSGVTIKVNGTATSITSTTRQTDHAVVHYVIPVLWHGSGDTVTWEYSSGSGSIVAESGGAALADVTAQSVTNNCEYAALLDLQADTLALNDGDPVSTWADQSGNGHDLTQTGTARPTYRAGGGTPCIDFDGIDDSMLGDNWSDLDNLPSMATLFVFDADYSNGTGVFPSINKLSSFATGQGWMIYGPFSDAVVQMSGDVFYDVVYNVVSFFGKLIVTVEQKSFSEISFYQNGVLGGTTVDDSGPVTSTTNNEPVRLCVTGTPGDGIIQDRMYAISIYAPIPNATNRAALEARLAARYGVTL